MKKLLFIVIIIILLLLIYKNNNYKEDYNLYFGNYNDMYVYRYNDTRIEDIIDDITNNIKINNKYIQNLLVKANYIVIDLNDLYINNKFLLDLEKLLINIRKYSKEKIKIKLRNSNNIKDKSINSMIFKLKNKYDIMIVR